MVTVSNYTGVTFSQNRALEYPDGRRRQAVTLRPGGEQWELRRCKFCPNGIASGTTPTAARTAALHCGSRSRQSNLLGCVPLALDCGSNSLSEETLG